MEFHGDNTHAMADTESELGEHEAAAYRAYVLGKIKLGLESFEHGQVATPDEVTRRMARWTSK